MALCLAQSVQGERVIVMEKYKVGRTFERIHGDVTTEYRVESIELNTNESCEGNPLHTVHMVDTATGHKWYSYAVTAELDDGLTRPVSVRPAEWMMRANTYTAYKSELYAVEVAGVSCMVTNLPSGVDRHFQGDDATDILGAIEVIPARVPESQIVTATDHYLSQYFG